MSALNTDPYVERFLKAYVDPDNAGFYLNPDKNETNQYIIPPGTVLYSTEDAIDDLFGSELSESELNELASELNDSYPDWAKRDEL